MKKFLTILVVLFVMMVSVPLEADAQSRCYRRTSASRKYNNRSNYRRANYRNVNRYGYTNASNRRSNYVSSAYVNDRPSFYRRHRNLVNLGVATGGGTLIGALTGGRRGALIGTAIGAGSGALYTYVLNKKKRRYYNR